MSEDWTVTWRRAVVAVLEAVERHATADRADDPERVLKYSQAAAALLAAGPRPEARQRDGA